MAASAMSVCRRRRRRRRRRPHGDHLHHRRRRRHRDDVSGLQFLSWVFFIFQAAMFVEKTRLGRTRARNDCELFVEVKHTDNTAVFFCTHVFVRLPVLPC